MKELGQDFLSKPNTGCRETSEAFITKVIDSALIYPHEKNKNDDLYIIIVIDDFDNVEVLTVYSFNKRRRERDIERK